MNSKEWSRINKLQVNKTKYIAALVKSILYCRQDPVVYIWQNYDYYSIFGDDDRYLLSVSGYEAMNPYLLTKTLLDYVHQIKGGLCG